MILICERCCAPIDRASEPLRLKWHRIPGHSDELAHWLQSAVHARQCTEPDVGEWDGIRRGAAPRALRHAAEQADDR